MDSERARSVVFKWLLFTWHCTTWIHRTEEVYRQSAYDYYALPWWLWFCSIANDAKLALNSFLFISNSLRFHFYSQSQNRKLYFLCAKSDEFRRPIFWANVIDATLIVIPTLLALWAFVNGWKLSFSLGKWKRATDQSENHIEPQKHEPHSNGMRSYELTIFEWNELRGHRASSDALIHTIRWPFVPTVHHPSLSTQKMYLPKIALIGWDSDVCKLKD